MVILGPTAFVVQRADIPSAFAELSVLMAALSADKIVIPLMRVLT
jgi:hypothetical protein